MFICVEIFFVSFIHYVTVRVSRDDFVEARENLFHLLKRHTEDGNLSYLSNFISAILAIRIRIRKKC